MKKINEKVYHYIGHVYKVEYFFGYAILYSETDKYLYVNKKTDTKVYDYLLSINFSNYLKLLSSSDDYSLFLIEVSDFSLIDVLADLCTKSYKSVINDDEMIKNIYDNIFSRIDSLYKYYLSVQDKIEEALYPSQSQYSLIINISLIYHLLDLGKYFLDKWAKSDNSIMREVLLFKDVSYRNFIDGNIISFDGTYFDKVAFMLDKYYKNNYLSNSLFDEIESFISKSSMTDSECFLFYTLISISREIDVNNIVDVNSLNFYVQETYKFLLKKYEENKESN